MEHGTVVVLTPAGRLDLSTYGEFRDGILRQIAEQPSAVVIVLGQGFELGSDPLTRVFATVWLRTRRWSGTPLILVAATGPHRLMIVRTGLSRFLPCFDRLEAALATTATPPGHRREEAQLPPGVDAPHLARDFIRHTCTAWDLRPQTPRAVVVGNHLVENVLGTTDASLTVRLDLVPDRLTIAVRHRGPPLGPGAPPDLTGVLRLATGCGHIPTVDGGIVLWALIALSPT
ncbi:STAS domain-containing protein [Saccharothrix sp.]|uniref:STAS domain-containing protein n=1 Tax=Saccharothrix sp. TaxID=1873460 RepID=UPI002812582F|nr:STAS domain-containing protein [Saccharothrix sp.]